MKRYKLIKEYPGSYKLGTIAEEANRGSIKYSGFNNNGANYSSLNFELLIATQPEFWQLIVEKEYEILSFNSKNNNYFIVRKEFADHCKYDLEKDYIIRNPKTWNIHSIKRLSDGEVFTIGDKVIHTNDVTNKIGVIKEFHILCNGIWFNTDEYDIPLCYVSAKVKAPLFTTEPLLTVKLTQTEINKLKNLLI